MLLNKFNYTLGYLNGFLLRSFSTELPNYDSNQKDLATAINQADSAAELTQLDPVEPLALPPTHLCRQKSYGVSEIKSGAVKVFSDLVNQRKEISNFLKGKSGIYCFLNKINGNCYIKNNHKAWLVDKSSKQEVIKTFLALLQQP